MLQLTIKCVICKKSLHFIKCDSMYGYVVFCSHLCARAKFCREFAKCRFAHFPSFFSDHVDTYEPPKYRIKLMPSHLVLPPLARLRQCPLEKWTSSVKWRNDSVLQCICSYLGPWVTFDTRSYLRFVVATGQWDKTSPTIHEKRLLHDLRVIVLYNLPHQCEHLHSCIGKCTKCNRIWTQERAD